MRQEWRAAREQLYPPRCPFCDRVLGLRDECSRCSGIVRHLELGRFRLNKGDQQLDGLEGAAAVYMYRDEVRQAILRMKYTGRACYGEVLGRILAQRLFGCTFESRGGIMIPCTVPDAALEYDLILPVPPSDHRRGFNPPERIARPLARALELPLETGALHKIRTTRRQEGLRREERLKNVRDAFRADPQRLPPNARVLLVDDVITTGATLSACAQALRRAGVDSVFGLSVAVSCPDPKE